MAILRTMAVCYHFSRGSMPTRDPGPAEAGMSCVTLAGEERALLLEELSLAGCSLIDVVGGEIFQDLRLPSFLREAKRLGLATSVTASGVGLEQFLAMHEGLLDRLVLPIDTRMCVVGKDLDLGLCVGRYLTQVRELALLVRDLEIELWVKTRVATCDRAEDMTPLIRDLMPQRWFVDIDPASVEHASSFVAEASPEEVLMSFAERHRRSLPPFLWPCLSRELPAVGRSVEIDPLGRFFIRSAQEIVYSPPILEVGVALALESLA